MGKGLRTSHAKASRAAAAQAVRYGGQSSVKTSPDPRVSSRRRYRHKNLLKDQSKYMPHQGKQEMSRRVRQMARVGDEPA